jgi:hypothetical protein
VVVPPFRRCVVAGALTTLMLAACGGSSDDPAAEPTVTTTANTATPPATPAPNGRPATAYTLAAGDVADPTLTTVCTVINGNSCVRLAFSRVHDYGEVTIETTRPVAEDQTAGELARTLTGGASTKINDLGKTASFTLDGVATAVTRVGDDLFVVAQSDALPVADVERRAASATANEKIQLPPEWYLVGSGTVDTVDEPYDYSIVTRSATESVDGCMAKTLDAVFADLREPSCNPVFETGVDFDVATEEDAPLFWGYAPMGTKVVHVIGDDVDTTVEPSLATLNGYPAFVVNIAPSQLELPTFHAFDAEGNQLGIYPDNG